MFKGSAHAARRPDGQAPRGGRAAGRTRSRRATGPSTQNVAASNFLEHDAVDRGRPARRPRRHARPAEARQPARRRAERAPPELREPAVRHGRAAHPRGAVAEGPPATTGRRSATPPTSRPPRSTTSRAFFKTYYVPNNATMVIAGDVKPDDVKRARREVLRLDPEARPTPRAPAVQDAAAARRRRSWSTRPTTCRCRASTSRGAAPARFTRRRAGARHGRGDPRRRQVEPALQAARLRREDRAGRPRRASAARSSAARSRSSRPRSRASIRSGSIAEISEEVAKLARRAPDADELERAQNSHEASFLDGLEPTLRARDPARRATTCWRTTPTTSRKDLARYRAVTPAQVKDAAAKYLEAERARRADDPARQEARRRRVMRALARRVHCSSLATAASGRAVRQVRHRRLDQAAGARPPEPTFEPPTAKRLEARERHGAARRREPQAADRRDDADRAGRRRGRTIRRARPGLAAFTADMLDEGAGGLTAIADRRGAGPARRGASALCAGTDCGRASRSATLTKTLDPTIDLLREDRHAAGVRREGVRAREGRSHDRARAAPRSAARGRRRWRSTRAVRRGLAVRPSAARRARVVQGRSPSRDVQAFYKDALEPGGDDARRRR